MGGGGSVGGVLHRISRELLLIRGVGDIPCTMTFFHNDSSRGKRERRAPRKKLGGGTEVAPKSHSEKKKPPASSLSQMFCLPGSLQRRQGLFEASEERELYRHGNIDGRDEGNEVDLPIQGRDALFNFTERRSGEKKRTLD